SLFHAGVEGIDVALHGRSRVDVVEHLLDVEKVEVVRAVFVGGPVQESGGGATKVVRRDVAEAGLSRAGPDDVLYRPSPPEMLSPVKAAWRRELAGLGRADERAVDGGLVGERQRVAAEVVPQHGDEGLARH